MKHALLTATALSLIFVTAARPAFADAETEALRQEIKALEARLAAIEKREKVTKPQPAQTVAAAPAPTQNLEQRVAIVERNQELAQDDAKAKAATTPTVDVGSKGLAVTSADKQYSINLRAYAQVDNRNFFSNGGVRNLGAGNSDTFLIRSARPIFEAKMTDYFNGRLMMDFGKGSTTLLDAYGDFHPMPGSDLINLRAGEFKVPVGLERWQSEQELLFVERGQTTNLVPYRDIGVMAYGQLITDQLEYQLGVLNGAADLQANNTDIDNNKDVAGRIFAHPFRWSNVSFLQGLGLGVGGTYGQHDGITSSSGTTSGLATGYVSVGQRTYFTYNLNDYANGEQWRINPQATYYNGPFSLLGEYVVNEQKISRAAASATLRNNAWEAIATYVLTGEDASFDGVKPLHNFHPSTGEWGAFELAVRVSSLSVDKRAFPIFADSTVSARRANESTIGANWYMNQSVKLNLDYSLTSFDGGNLRNTDRRDEQVLMSRAQFRF